MYPPDGSLQALRANGIKATPQRLAILDYIRTAGSHPRADEVFQHVRRLYPGMSRATVYNTLNTLVEKDLLQQVPSTGGYCRFDARLEPHYHVVCELCGQIEDYATDPQVENLHRAVSRQTGYLVRGHSLEFRGLCPACRQTSGVAGAKAKPRQPALSAESLPRPAAATGCARIPAGEPGQGGAWCPPCCPRPPTCKHGATR